MAFVLTMGILAAVAAALSGAITAPVYRLSKPAVKPLAAVLGVILFFLFLWAAFVILVVVSARRGHPF